MITPITGEVYKFTFLDEFKVHDGIYEVLEILSYKRMLETGNTLNETYTKAGKSINDLDNDVVNYRSDQILKLRDVNSDVESILIIPKSLFKYTPDNSVKEYPEVALILDIGPVKDPEQLSFIVNLVKEHITTDLGLENDPYLFEHNKRYLSDEEYEAIKAKQDAAKKRSMTYMSEFNTVKAENVRLQTIARELSDLVVAQHGKES